MQLTDSKIDGGTLTSAQGGYFQINADGSGCPVTFVGVTLSGGSTVDIDPGATLALDCTTTLQGGVEIAGLGTLSNNGLIALTCGETVTIDVADVVNCGTIAADDGATLDLSAYIDNYDTIAACGTGSLIGLFDTVISGGTLFIGSGAAVDVGGSGALLFDVAVIDNGTLALNGGFLAFTGDSTVSGCGSIDISGGGVATFFDALDSNLAVNFGGGGVLALAAAPDGTLVINNFGTLDALNLFNIPTSDIASATFTPASGNSTTLTIGGESFTFVGDSDNFTLVGDTSGGTDVFFGAEDAWTKTGRGASGAWGSTNWSTGSAPSAAENAVLGGTHSYTVTLSGGVKPVNILTISDPNATLQGFGTISGGIVNAGTIEALENSGGTLTLDNDVLNSGTLWAFSGNTLKLKGSVIDNFGTITDDGTLSIDAAGGILSLDAPTGTGTVTLANGSIDAAPGQTLANWGNTIEGSGHIGHGTGNLTLENFEGTIDATVSGQTLTIDTGNGVFNAGILEATNGATLAIDDPVANNGVIEADEGTVDLTNTVIANSGTIETDPILQAGTINLTSVEIIGGQLQIESNGTVNVDAPGARLVDVALTDNGTLNVNSGFFVARDGSTVTGTGNVDITGGAVAVFYGALDSNLSVKFSGDGVLALDAAPCGTDPLTINGFSAGDALNLLNVPFTGTSTLEVPSGGIVTIDDESFTFAGDDNDTLTLVSDGTGGTMVLFGGEDEWTQTSGSKAWEGNSGNNWSDGVPTSSENAVVDLPGTYTITLSGGTKTMNSLTISDPDAILQGFGKIEGAIINAGTIAASGGTLTLDGDVLNSGTLSAPGGATLKLEGGANENVGNIAVSGTLSIDATGGIFDLDSGNGAGTVTLTGGTMEAAAAGQTLVNLDNTIEGDGAIGTGDGHLTLENIFGTIDANISGETLTINTGNTVTSAGLLEATNGGILDIQDGTVDNAGTILIASTLEIGSTLTLTGSGVVALEGGVIDPIVESTLTNVDNTISGSGEIGPNLTLVNAGTVDANFVGETLTVDTGSTVTNTGTLEATAGGTLVIDDRVDNAGGTIAASGASQVELYGATIQGGTIAANGAGQVELLYATIQGGTIAANGAGQVELTFATIQGGTLTTSGPGSSGSNIIVEATSYPNLSVFDGATDGPLTVAGYVGIFAGAQLELTGAINVDGAYGQIDVAGPDNGSTSPGILLIDGAATLATDGASNNPQITLGTSTTGLILASPYGFDDTLDNSVWISGVGQIGAGDGALTLINEATGQIQANPGSSPSGTLTLDIGANNPVTNLGTIDASAGATLVIENSTIDNSGGTISAGAADSTVQLSDATIVGGALLSGNGGTFQIDDDNGLGVTFDGVTIDAGTIVGVSAGASLFLVDTTTLQSGVEIVGAGSITNDGTFVGAGTIGGTGDLTLTNDGTIDANVSGETLTIDTGNTVINTSVMEASGGGILTIDDAVTGDGLIIASDAQSMVDVNNAITGGTLEAIGGLLSVGDASLPGVDIFIAGYGTANFAETLNQDVTFLGAGTLVLQSLADNAYGTVHGFGLGDTIDLAGVPYQAGDTPDLVGNSLEILNLSNQVVATLTLDGNYTQDDFALQSDGSPTPGTEVVFNVTDTWQGASDEWFGNPAVDWSNGAPTSDDNAEILTTSGAIVVTIGNFSNAESATADSLLIGDDVTLDIGGAGSSLTVGGRIDDFGAIQNTVTASVATITDGTLTIEPGASLAVGPDQGLIIDSSDSDGVNANFGLIEASGGGLEITNSGLAINEFGATIEAINGGGGITFNDNNDANYGTIVATGSSSAIDFNVSGTSDNFGTIEALDAPQPGNAPAITFTGNFVNEANGSVLASGSGNELTNIEFGNGELTNDGTMEATGIFGILTVDSGNTITNAGLLEATNFGTLDIQDAQIDNTGTGANGISIGSLTLGGATLLVDNADLQLTGGGNVSLAFGTIMENANNSAVLSGGTLTLDNVDNTIEGYGTIGDGTGGLTLTNAGTVDANVNGFGFGFTLTIDTGNGNIVTNTGTLEATNGGQLAVLDPVNNAGGNVVAASSGFVDFDLNISGGNATINDATLLFGWSSGVNVAFAGSYGALEFNGGQAFGGTISGFGVDDTIDVQNILGAPVWTQTTTGPNASGTLSVGTQSLTLAGTYNQDDFSAISDNNGGTLVVFGDEWTGASSDSLTDNANWTYALTSSTDMVIDLTGFQTISATGTVDANSLVINDVQASLSLTGPSTFATIDNLGAIVVEDTATITGTVNGSGNLQIDPGATLTLDGASTNSVYFLSNTGALDLAAGATLSGAIHDFTGTAANAAQSDVIDVAGVNFNSGHFSDSYNAATGVLTVSDGANSASLTFDNFTGTFKFASDGSGGTDIYDPPATNSSSPSASVTNDSFTFHHHDGAGAGNSDPPAGPHDFGQFTATEIQQWLAGDQPAGAPVDVAAHIDAHWHHALQNSVHLH